MLVFFIICESKLNCVWNFIDQTINQWKKQKGNFPWCGAICPVMLSKYTWLNSLLSNSRTIWSCAKSIHEFEPWTACVFCTSAQVEICVCMFEQRAMFVLQMTLPKLLLQRWNVVSLWIVYACMWVWLPDWCILMVLLHAVAEHWGVTWKSVRELSVLPDIFSTWGKREGMDRFFLYWQVHFLFLLEISTIHCMNMKEGVSLCVPCMSLLTAAGCAQWVKLRQQPCMPAFI